VQVILWFRTVDYLVVAGGGAGGSPGANAYESGGGGAGGLRIASSFPDFCYSNFQLQLEQVEQVLLQEIMVQIQFLVQLHHRVVVKVVQVEYLV
jgi:hypothetical protein